jgi:hypothetical protein
MRVTGVTIDAQGNGNATWSDARNMSPYGMNAAVAVPSAVAQPNSFIVMAEVHYDYTPTIGYVMTGTFDFNNKFFLRPRLMPTVTRIP